MPTALRGAAEDAAADLSTVPWIEGVCLFGSVARDDHDETSDIDLLILGTEATRTPGDVRRQLRTDLRERVSISYYTPPSLVAYLERWSRFGVHLRTEGRILFDHFGRLRAILAQPRTLSTEFELEVQLGHLETLDHVERFGGLFLIPLARLYRVGRTVVFALLAEMGVFEFNQEKAFEDLARRLPEAAHDVRAIERLRPFARLVRGRIEPDRLPFSSEGCPIEVKNAIEAIRRLTRFSQHAGSFTY